MTPEVAAKVQAYAAKSRVRLGRSVAGSSDQVGTLANLLMQDAEFAATGICSFWRNPTVEEVRDVLLALPDPYGLGVPADLMAHGMHLACSQRARGPRTLGVAGVGITALAWLLYKRLGGGSA